MGLLFFRSRSVTREVLRIAETSLSSGTTEGLTVSMYLVAYIPFYCVLYILLLRVSGLRCLISERNYETDSKPEESFLVDRKSSVNDLYFKNIVPAPAYSIFDCLLWICALFIIQHIELFVNLHFKSFLSTLKDEKPPSLSRTLTFRPELRERIQLSGKEGGLTLSGRFQ